ncbi:hypothetical protein SO802_028648 [Lithocarpus litseifolius]|uniref:Uncharacterized protein n=1 Tax=Lithocarpus litseifolius TaxID=425828 RepID=A0AAW2BU12_9ROSI
MTVIWTSGYGINEAGAFVEWGPKGGDQVHSPAGTSTFDCNSMSYDTEMHTHTDTHISFQQAEEDCSKGILHDKKGCIELAGVFGCGMGDEFKFHLLNWQILYSSMDWVCMRWYISPSYPLHQPHSATFPPLFAAKNHCFSTFFCRNLFGEDEFNNSEFFKNAVEETIIL